MGEDPDVALWDHFSRICGVAWSVIGFAIAGFCIWIVIRIVNRKSRWLPWFLASVATAIIYVGSFGLVFLLEKNNLLGRWAQWINAAVYFPLFWLAHSGPKPIRDLIDWYVRLWVGDWLGP